MFKYKAIYKKYSDDIEPHEVILDVLAEKKEKEMGIESFKIENLLPKRVLVGFIFLFMIFLSFICFEIFQLQFVEGKNYRLMSDKNQFTFNKVNAERGVIYDKNYRQLVWNKFSFDLILEKEKLPNQLEERNSIIKKVANILNYDFQELKDKIDSTENKEILISNNIPLDKLIIIESLKEEINVFEVRNNSIRDYRLGYPFSHLIGYMGLISKEEFLSDSDFYTSFDWVGKSGLEKYYENVLRKNPGKIKEERDALGNLVSRQVIETPKSGNSLVLWLDSELQEKIRDELAKKVSEVGAKGGVAIAMDPKTGGILSLVSIPDFDNNIFQNNRELAKEIINDKTTQPLFNRAVSGKYLVGSTIKPLIALAALQEKIIDPDKQINTHGFIEVPNIYNPDIIYRFNDWTVHGLVDMEKAIAQSSNVYFYIIGGGYKDQKGLGPTKIKEYLDLFGWTKKTGIDLPFEVEGFIPDKEWKQNVLKEPWVDGDTYYLSIGQQYIQITPIEVVTSFAAIANGGTLLKPMIVKEIVDSDKNVIKEFKPEIVRDNFISKENIDIVKEGMRRAVSGEGAPLASASILNSLPVSAAAKTGTAELGNNYFNNWVTVFAPVDDPQIVITIMVEKVENLRGVVLPVAKDILEWYFKRDNKSE
jgi:penicillin-binding protein 2